MDKPFSQAAENNKVPILQVLQEHFSRPASILEIGSGTGQHAQFFAQAMPHLQWLPSEVPAGLQGLQVYLRESDLPNLHAPMALDVSDPVWPLQRVGGVFSANTLHIMPWSSVPELFQGVGRVLEPGGRLCIYGPFKYEGAFTTQSNADFDRWLKSRAPHQGIRDFEAVDRLAQAQGMFLLEDRNMPANNQLLSWEMA